MRRAAALLIGLGGCADLFNLEPVTTSDALVPGDVSTCATATGHDEDGDLLDDGCDPCPGDPDPLPTDGDADGIGDACDPDPGLPGHTLVHFYSFASASDGDHFTLLPAGWSITGDALVYDQLSPNTFIELMDPPPDLPYAAQMAVTIDAVDRTLYDQIGIGGNSSGTGAHLQCVLFHATAGADGWQAAATGGASDSLPLLANTYVAGTHAVMRMQFRPDGDSCDLDATRPSNDTVGGVTSIANVTAGPSTFALNVQETKIRITWLAVYSVP